MHRRTFIKAGAAMAALPSARADVPNHLWQGYDFGSGPSSPDRLNQGPFGIEQDEGWFTIAVTSQSDKPVRNYGLGLVGYAWEEGGPSIAAREGRETLEQHVERLASLPFVDVLYIRCDWRNVQKQPGKLDLDPVWKLTFDAAKRHGLRVAFRIQMSNTVFQPEQLAIPKFLQEQVPLVKIGRTYRKQNFEYVEPRYDHPAFQKAFRELNELLAARFDSDPLMEWVDLMMYGFWGEGHTSDAPNPFPDYLTAERTFVDMTRFQIDAWKHVPLAVNTQPDISKVGNNTVREMCVRAGCWLRSDSIIVEEPQQIEEIANRPPWLAAIMEDGFNRQYDINAESMQPGPDGLTERERSMLHVLDLGANYWALWTESANLARFNEKYPEGFRTLQSRMGYRVRPSWIWQRKRYGTSEIIVAFANDGVAGVPGLLRVTLESRDGKFKSSGTLDAGHPYGGRIREAAFVLPKGMDGQEFVLRGEIETKGVRRPVRWACRQQLNPDGSLTFRSKPLNDPDWRKGV